VGDPIGVAPLLDMEPEVTALAVRIGVAKKLVLEANRRAVVGIILRQVAKTPMIKTPRGRNFGLSSRIERVSRQ